MQHNYHYRGGVWKPSDHSMEKFLLFLLVGDQEVPHYQAIKEGVAARLDAGVDEFVTSHPVVKLFVSRKGFGLKDQYHSFWIRLDESESILKIVPFSGDKDGHYFKGKSKIMKRDEVLELLSEESPSKLFFGRQEVLPINLMAQMVSIDRGEIKANVRYVKIGKGGK